MHRKITFTQDGLDTFTKEYDELIAKRPQTVAELSRARDMGDRSENAAYKSARHALSTIDRRIRHLKKILDNAVVTAISQYEFVDIGHTVIVKINDIPIEYTIVGGYESDIVNGKLSFHSPVGKSLLGKKIGDSFSVHTPSGIKTYTILDIKKV